MAVTTILTITSENETAADLEHSIKAPAGQPGLLVQKLIKFLSAMASGSRQGTLDLQVNYGDAEAAQGGITLSSFANNDTVTVAGEVFTAKTSGASGDNQFNLGANDTAAAAALAAKINAHPDLAGVVTAAANGTGVTVTAAVHGAIGNQIGLAISAHGSVSGANLVGGENATANTFGYGT